MPFTPSRPTNSGWIEVICGPMFCGKTEELIRRLRRAEIAQMKTVIFKPLIDNRYSDDHIVSHNQRKLKSLAISDVNEILNLSGNADVIGIDEAQFFNDDLVDVCRELAENNKRVVVAGLDSDYRNQPFGPMPRLLCEAEYVDKIWAICVKCGNPASFTQRKISESEQVMIGETDIYEARCRTCYESPIE